MSKKSIYLIYGNDEYLVSTKAREITKKLVPPENKMLGLDVVDGSAATVDEAVGVINRCLSALQSMGLFSEEKVVWLKDVNFLYDNRTGMSATVKEQIDRLTALIKAGLSPELTLVISADKVDKRKAFFKACKASGELHEFMVPEKAYQADKFADRSLDQITADVGIQLVGDARSLFIAKVGYDTRNMVNEVEKLATYMGKSGRASVADVQAIVSSSRDAIAWDLADAFGKRDLPEALRVLRQLVFQKENIIGIVIGLENRIRELILYREAFDRGWIIKKSSYGRDSFAWGDVGAEADEFFGEKLTKDPRKTHPFRANLLAQQARRFSRKRLRYCLSEITKAHAELVSSRVPQEMTLEFLLIRMLAVG